MQDKLPASKTPNRNCFYYNKNTIFWQQDFCKLPKLATAGLLGVIKFAKFQKNKKKYYT